MGLSLALSAALGGGLTEGVWPLTAASGASPAGFMAEEEEEGGGAEASGAVPARWSRKAGKSGGKDKNYLLPSLLYLYFVCHVVCACRTKERHLSVSTFSEKRMAPKQYLDSEKKTFSDSTDFLLK